jgi:hypothetical protein
MSGVRFLFFLQRFFVNLMSSFSGIITYLTELHDMPNGDSWSYLELMFTVGLPFFLLWTFLTWVGNIIT